jgi:hypothetical protein
VYSFRERTLERNSYQAITQILNQGSQQRPFVKIDPCHTVYLSGHWFLAADDCPPIYVARVLRVNIVMKPDVVIGFAEYLLGDLYTDQDVMGKYMGFM